MLLIAAFYDSTFNDLLDQNSLFAMLDLNEQTIYNMMSAMSVDQLELMNKLVPATYQSYYRRKNPEKFKDFLRKQSNDPVVENNKEENGLEVRSFANLMASNGKYTEIENKFKYTKNTHDTYDPMLRTSAQRVVDVFLPGKRGLDFELVRSYNSLNAKTETQRSHRPWSYPEGAAEYHPIANSPDGVLYEDYHNLGDGRNSIAAGWQFNIPYMNSYPEMPFHSKHQITVEQAKNSTNIPSKYGQYIYYNMSDHGANYIKRDVSFTLEDGTTYEFNNGIKDRSYNYPDRNVKYTEINALNGTVYLLVLDDQITYNFFKSRDESYGPISSKSNIYGDTIRYGGTSVEMPYTEHRLFTRIITDSVGRKIEITMPSDPLKRPETRLVVKGKDGSILKDLKYNSIQTYRDYVMVPTKYSYLVSVVDQLTNKTLQSYTYYDMANWFAEYNMEDDYYADTEGNYNVIFDGGHENSKIMVNDSRTWGYNNFLLLKEVKDESGFSIHYQYKYHDEKWTNYVNGRLSFRELDTMRGSMRLYNDPHVLTYTGYHPVTSIFYTYTNADGQPKLFEQELQKDPNTSNEIWNRPKSGGELGDFRLSRVDSYRSGDKILTKITSKYEGYTDTKTLRFQAACKRIPSTFVVSS
ncbi:hypothetical protein L3i20_v248500 [Paenibacillus sp. L3-i20]|nr:hypothetical protein L3i20_v248500 [Paenibacillus sp. L3-i20]